MLKLICGPSGSGKTDLLLQRISADIQNGIRCFLLVPEQQAYISERDFSASFPKIAGLYFEIVHFSGLADDVFREYGGVTKSSASNGLRALLMWDTLRTISPMLRCYGENAKSDNTLASLLLQTISEMRSNGITGEKLEEVSNLLPQDSPLQKKLSDLALIEAVYHQKIRESFGEDPEDRLIRLADKLKEHSYFKDAHIYIDSFTSFTAQEYNVLREIMKQAEQTTVALCADHFTSTLPHFETVVQTACRLQKIASEIGTPVEKTELQAESAHKSEELLVIERDLWRFDAKAEPMQKQDSGDSPVTLLRCKNLYEESEAAALNILALAQSGVRYGDIAVVVRDTETYRGVLDAAMERYQIPYFLSERTDFSQKPLFRMILSALRASYRYYPAQEIMTLIKTGLAGVDLRDGSMFEEYCETWHISGARFLDDAWSMNPDGLTTERSPRAEIILTAANKVRKAVIEPLQLLSAELNHSQRLTDKCAALYRYLGRLKVAQTLSEQAKQDLAANRRREAGEAVRLYTLLCDTLTTLCKLLPDSEMTTEEFATALSLLFSETDFGSVPNLHDCVMIGSASTLRVEKVRASLLLGLCEGEFPKATSGEGLLSEGDKEALEEFGLIFDSREKTNFSEELLYVYRAMTKPFEKLYLSTVLAEPDGSARTPSLAFNRVAFLLGQKAQEFSLKDLRVATNSISNSAEEQVHALPPLPAGSTLRLSQTKIKTFVLCPYSYYCTYQLKLREKKDSAPSYADDGTFLHYVFEHFLASALQEDGSLVLPAMSEAEEIAEGIMIAYLEEVCPLGLTRINGRLLHLYTRLRKLALLMLEDMIAELSVSRFVPSRFEQVIGSAGEDGLPEIRLALKDGSSVLLNGKIDRLDLYKTDERIYVRVVDYKTGEHKFALKDVASGMDIQLILYLFATLSKDRNRYAVGGAEYLYVKTEKGQSAIHRSGLIAENEEIKQAFDASEDKRFSKKLLAQTQEEINGLMEQMKQTVQEIAERILAGEASKTPSEDACRFCSVADHCDKAYRK